MSKLKLAALGVLYHNQEDLAMLANQRDPYSRSHEPYRHNFQHCTADKRLAMIWRSIQYLLEWVELGKQDSSPLRPESTHMLFPWNHSLVWSLEHQWFADHQWLPWWGRWSVIVLLIVNLFQRVLESPWPWSRFELPLSVAILSMPFGSNTSIWAPMVARSTNRESGLSFKYLWSFHCW